jgi:hypothetical protein
MPVSSRCRVAWKAETVGSVRTRSFSRSVPIRMLGKSRVDLSPLSRPSSTRNTKASTETE